MGSTRLTIMSSSISHKAHNRVFRNAHDDFFEVDVNGHYKDQPRFTKTSGKSGRSKRHHHNRSKLYEWDSDDDEMHCFNYCGVDGCSLEARCLAIIVLVVVVLWVMTHVPLTMLQQGKQILEQ